MCDHLHEPIIFLSRDARGVAFFTLQSALNAAGANDEAADDRDDDDSVVDDTGEDVNDEDNVDTHNGTRPAGDMILCCVHGSHSFSLFFSPSITRSLNSHFSPVS